MKQFTCIMCPVGCTLSVSQNGDEIAVSGNACIRGKRYGESEITNPTRMVTSLVKMQNGNLCSVKTSTLVPKDKVFDVLQEIAKLTPNTARQGEILLKNVCGLENVDIVVTREC